MQQPDKNTKLTFKLCLLVYLVFFNIILLCSRNNTIISSLSYQGHTVTKAIIKAAPRTLLSILQIEGSKIIPLFKYTVLSPHTQERSAVNKSSVITSTIFQKIKSQGHFWIIISFFFFFFSKGFMWLFSWNSHIKKKKKCTLLKISCSIFSCQLLNSETTRPMS